MFAKSKIHCFTSLRKYNIYQYQDTVFHITTEITVFYITMEITVFHTTAGDTVFLIRTMFHISVEMQCFCINTA